MNTPDSDEFFIGWNPTPPRTKVLIRRTVLVLLLWVGAGALIVGALQGTIGVATFEFGNTREFQGVLCMNPVPMLIVDGSASDDGERERSHHLLVNPFKFGFDPELAAQFDGQFVSLRGTLIYRDNQTMIEAVPGTMRRIDGTAPNDLDLEAADLGMVTLRGEIVDSKCYFGVMNPGDWKPHRACAVRCISGGIPPVLHVRTLDGDSAYFVLTSSTGESITQSILPYVAIPVEVDGQLKQLGDLFVLYMEPDTIKPR